MNSIADLKIVITSSKSPEYLAGESFMPIGVIGIDRNTNEKVLLWIEDYKIIRLEDYNEVC